jgi:hypothetical protein
VIAHCFIFTSNSEFDAAHLECHREFCQIIEDTLNIYLLDVIGIQFTQFHEACEAAAEQSAGRDTIAGQVLAVLKQVTDFRYFAAKMHAYNVVLDREAASAFAGHIQGPAAYFVSDEVLQEEQIDEPLKTSSGTQCEYVPKPVQVAAEVKKPPAKPVKVKPQLCSACTQTDEEVEEVVPTPEAPLPAPQEVVTVPEVKVPPPVVKQEVEAPPKLKLLTPSATQHIVIPPQVKAAVQAATKAEPTPSLAQTAKPAEPKKRLSSENIDLNLSKHERPKAAAPEDPMLALRRALAGRVRNIIDES